MSAHRGIQNTSDRVLKETIRAGDEAFNRGQYKEALQEYDKAILTKPRYVYLKIHRAEALVCLGRFAEAINEFMKAYAIDPNNGRIHHRLSLLHLRLGVIELAEFYMRKASLACREDLRVKIAKVKDHLVRGEKARKDDNWIAALNEVNAMIAAGADSSQRILAFRAEMLLRLDKLDQADEAIKRANALQTKLKHMCLFKFLGMPPDAYFWATTAQIELALGRGDKAIAATVEASRLCQLNDEISAILRNVRLVYNACYKGNMHYKSRNFLKAQKYYQVGLENAKSNVSLLNNLAACHWKLETWENCIEICNQVLQIWPDNGKALGRRADSYAKLEKWAEAVKDYEAAIKISPESKKLSKGLKASQAALKESQVTELADTLVEAKGAVKESQVTELAEKLVEAHVRDQSQVEDVSGDRLAKMRVKRRRRLMR